MKILADNVNCKYGSPMGRANYTLRSGGKILYSFDLGYTEYMAALRDMPHKFLLQDARVSGGYDRGGAYWGSGQRVYLAESENGNIFRSFRADNRAHAYRLLREEFPHAQVYGFAADITKRDGRYTVTKEWTGEKSPQWIVRFCDEWVTSCPGRADALRAANVHDAERLK
jgi:hypothetical protein